jgi:predicted amidohydrolase
VPIGNAILVSNDGILIGFEMCEELWVPNAMHQKLYLDGADIVINSSASHYERHK